MRTQVRSNCETDNTAQPIRDAVRSARTRMVSDLRILGPDTRLSRFMQEADVALEEIYANPRLGHCFIELRRNAGFSQGTGLPAQNDPLLRTIGRLIHVDDHERIKRWRNILETDYPDPISILNGRDHRLGLMLFAVLGRRDQSIAEADQVVNRIRDSADLRREVCDLLEILADRIRTVSQPLDLASEIPLASHSTYTLAEIMAAHKRTGRSGAFVLPQGGVLWDETTQTDLLFVTLEKSEIDYSPTTRYADYPISPNSVPLGVAE